MNIFSKKDGKNRMATSSKRRLFRKSVPADPILPMPPLPLYATPWGSNTPAIKPFAPGKPGLFGRSKQLPVLNPPAVPLAGSRPRRSRREKREDANKIHSFEELLVALSNHESTITLGDDIIVKNNIQIDYDVTINLGGHNVVSERDLPMMRIFDVRHGEFTLTGEGNVFAMGPDSVALRVFGAISTGVPDYTVVTVDETSGTAIDASGIGDWNLASTKLRGFLGIKAEYGRFTLSNSNIATSSVAILLNTDAGAGLSLTIDGGSFQSTDALTILGKPTGINKFVVKSGDFCSERGIINRELSKVAVFEGGDFYDNLVDFAARNQQFTGEAPEITPELLAAQERKAKRQASKRDTKQDTKRAKKSTAKKSKK